MFANVRSDGDETQRMQKSYACARLPAWPEVDKIYAINGRESAVPDSAACAIV